MSSSSQTNDLKNRIIFTIFILAVYRFGTFVPIPGIDPEQLQTMMSGNQKDYLECSMFFQAGL
jgi:preprotein translocase subunit SecY